MTHASWGPGWPNCQTSKINTRFFVDTRWGRVTFPGGVRQEICELVSRLVKETSNRGYRFGTPANPSYGCWGFACRAIRGKKSPSNHSWGLAIDINAPTNPMGAPLRTDMPSWMPDLWNAYGFRWGGDYRTRPDSMHYEFMGSVNDAVRMTQKARQNRLGEGAAPQPPKPKPPVEEDDMPPPVLARMTDDTCWLLTPGFRQRIKGQEDYNLAIMVHGAKYDEKANDAFRSISDQFILDHKDVSTT